MILPSPGVNPGQVEMPIGRVSLDLDNGREGDRRCSAGSDTGLEGNPPNAHVSGHDLDAVDHSGG
jgi:hypothetical protein